MHLFCNSDAGAFTEIGHAFEAILGLTLRCARNCRLL